MIILVAEDEALILNSIAFKLQRENFEVLKAKDGKEALELLKTHSPDLVITDIVMPFYSGLEVLSKIKSINSKIPVIMLSALGQENSVLEAFKIGANDYITKPFSPNELVVRIKKLLELK